MNCDHEEMHITEAGQPTAASINQPTLAIPCYIDTTPQTFEYTHDGYDLPDIDWYIEEENQVVSPGLTQGTPSWVLWDPTRDLNNPYLDDMIPEDPVVDAEGTDDLNSYVDESVARPHSTTNPQAENTRVRLPDLGFSFPERTMRPTSPYDHGRASGPAGPIKFAVPLPPAFPVSEQQQDGVGEMTAARTHAFNTPVVGYHSYAMTPGGQLNREAPPSDVNSDRSAPFVCLCGSRFRDADGLRYEFN